MGGALEAGTPDSTGDLERCGVLGGLGINQCRVATWELHPGDSRSVPTRGLHSIPECDMEHWEKGLQEQREGEAEANCRELNTPTVPPDLVGEGLRNSSYGAQLLKSAKLRSLSCKFCPNLHTSPVVVAGRWAGGRASFGNNIVWGPPILIPPGVAVDPRGEH